MKIKVREAQKLLRENGFELLHQKGSHMKYGKGSVRCMITEGGWKGSGELHSKQIKELMTAIHGDNNIKEQLKQDNERISNNNI